MATERWKKIELQVSLVGITVNTDSPDLDYTGKNEKKYIMLSLEKGVQTGKRWKKASKKWLELLL